MRPPTGPVPVGPSGSVAAAPASSSASGVYDPGSSYVAPKKSKAGLIVAILAVLAVGGGVAAFAVLGGKKADDGGGATGRGSGSQVVTNNVGSDVGSGSGSAGSAGSAVTGDGSGSATDQVAAAMAKMSGFADAMCACADAACADKVQQELDAWVTENGGTPTGVAPEISGRLAECRSKALAALPPDAGVPAPKVIHVVVSTNVATFEIWEDGKKLTTGPDSLAVPDGTERKLTLKAKGYRDADVTLDSKTKKQKFILKREASTNVKPNHGTNTTNQGPKCSGTKVDLQSDTCRPVYCKAHPADIACSVE
jgi:hypothetical protein